MQTEGTRPGAATATPGKAPRPPKADSFKHAMARAQDGAGPSASAAALRPRPARPPAMPAVANAPVPTGAPTAPTGTPTIAPGTEAALRQRIAVLESGGGPTAHLARNAGSGALGRYQMLPIALRDIGWMDAAGAWTDAAARHGVGNEAEFLASPAAQEAAMDTYLRRTELQLDRNGALARAGGAVPGIDGQAVPLTEAGLVAAAHRRGPASVARYLAHRTDTPDVPLTPDQAVAFAQVERRLRDFAALPYSLASRPGGSRAG